MLEVYSWPTPNGHKVHIALEELGLPYKVIPVNIGAGDQFKPEFLKITPNHRIPAIVDSDGPGGHPGDEFVRDIALVSKVPLHPLAWRRPSRIPGLLVEAVDTPQLDVAVAHLVLERAHHPEVLPLVEPPRRRRERQQRQPGVAEPEQLHVPAERPAPVLAVLPRGPHHAEA